MGVYIGKEHDEAFKKFNIESVDDRIKGELFTKTIHPALKKLVTNLIYQYGLTTDENSKELHDDCVSHMIMQIPKYDYDKASSFSFFNVVANNFIRQYLDRRKKYSPIDAIFRKDVNDSAMVTDENKIQHTAISDKFIDNSYINAGESSEDEFFKYVQSEIARIIVECSDKKEKIFLKHTLTMMESKDYISINSKKQFYWSMKNLSDLKSREIAKYLGKLKNTYFKEIKYKYYNKSEAENQEYQF